MEGKDDIEMKDENSLNPISAATMQYNNFENIQKGAKLPDFIPLEDNSEENTNQMDTTYINTNLEINNTESLDYIIEKYSSEIREKEDTVNINSEFEEGDANFLDFTKKKLLIQIGIYLLKKN